MESPSHERWTKEPQLACDASFQPCSSRRHEEAEPVTLPPLTAAPRRCSSSSLASVHSSPPACREGRGQDGPWVDINTASPLADATLGQTTCDAPPEPEDHGSSADVEVIQRASRPAARAREQSDRRVHGVCDELQEAREQQRRTAQLLEDRERVILAQERAIAELLQSRAALHEQQARMQELLDGSRAQAQDALDTAQLQSQRLEEVVTGLESERDEAVAHSNIIVDDFRALNEQYVAMRQDNAKLAEHLFVAKEHALAYLAECEQLRAQLTALEHHQLPGAPVAVTLPRGFNASDNAAHAVQSTMTLDTDRARASTPNAHEESPAQVGDQRNQQHDQAGDEQTGQFEARARLSRRVAPLSASDLQGLEADLLQFNIERDALLSEQCKLPAHGGRSLQQRRRKQYVEDRLAQLERDISRVRLTLKQSALR